MGSSPVLLRGMVCLMAAAVLPFTVLGQTSRRIAPVPGDPLELVTGPIRVAGTTAQREAAVQLLGRARSRFVLRNAGVAYSLKVSFAVDSRGETNYDGAWEMEDQFSPADGLRWTAKAVAGYVTTRLSKTGPVYGEEGTAGAIPLRLHEVRGLINDPLPSPAYARRGSIRTSTATFHGVTLTCLLLSPARTSVNPASGRGWEENEECIDPQSGLIQVHSEAPGRYVVYDYSNAPQLGDCLLPRTVTVTEAGRTVLRISVDSLTETASFDRKLFDPTESMKMGEQTKAIAPATKMTRVHGQSANSSRGAIHTVCIFGVVTPSGQLVEAHSLQPSDPHSVAALDDAKTIDFSPSISAGAPPQQHFVFVIEEFVSPR